MLHEKIRNVSARLGELTDRLSEEDYQLIRMARASLTDLADRVATLEAHACLPGEPAQEGA